MKNKEAISILRNAAFVATSTSFQSIEEAVEIAVKALEEQEVSASWEYAYKVSLSMENEKAQKRLNDLIFDINPAEICSQIESDNLHDWCKTIQTEMKMAMVQLPCWGGNDERTG